MEGYQRVTGMVLSAMSIGEYDRRIVILTKEMGKISAFAKGARRQGSALAAGSRPFSFGEFSLVVGRSSYTIRSMQISNYFENITEDFENTCMGTYFLELAEYYTRENNDDTEMLKLLYQSLRALNVKSLEHRLVKTVYELKAMMINGDYSDVLPAYISAITRQVLQHILESTVNKLYTFTVSKEVLKQLEAVSEYFRLSYITKEFKSLKVMEDMKNLKGSW